jgi:hypothetical protein
MKVLLWGSVAFLSVLWTSGAALLSQGVVWTSRRMSEGPAVTLETAANSVIIPVWMTPWFDPSALNTVLQTAQGIMGNFFSVLPTMGMVLAWLVPAIWITWGIGMLILLGAVIVGTGILQRIQKS